MAPPNDNDNIKGKQKKGYARLLYVAVSTAILLLALVLYTNSDDIPIGDRCLITDDNCVIPLGLTHGVCRNHDHGGDVAAYVTYFGYGTCQSGQAGSLCGVTDDCVVQTGLTPPHAVCRGPALDQKCQR